jgi:putative phage-type endonuclease
MSLSFNSREDWLRWRMGKLGSSDAPIIMGVSEFSTILKLYNQKIAKDPTEDDSDSFIKRLGNAAEPKIRALCELKLGKSFKACNLESSEFPFLSASMDGRSPCTKEGLEIKLINKEDWEAGKKNGFVPKQYKPQVYHQMNVGNLDVVYLALYLYSAFKDNPSKVSLENLVIIPCYPEIEYQTELLKAEIQFWDLVTTKKPPSSGKGDLVPLNGMKDWANQWKSAQTKIEKISAQLKVKTAALDEKMAAALMEVAEAEQAMKDAAKEGGQLGYLCYGLEIKLSSRIGAIDYANIPELASVKLDEYRKPGTTSWSIKPTKEKEANGKTSKG